MGGWIIVRLSWLPVELERTDDEPGPLVWPHATADGAGCGSAEVGR